MKQEKLDEKCPPADTAVNTDSDVVEERLSDASPAEGEKTLFSEKFDETITEDSESSTSQANDMYALANAAFDQGDYTAALAKAEETLVLAEKYNLSKFKTEAWHIIATVYFNFSEYQRALEYYLKVLALDEALGNTAGIAADLGNIGLVYLQLSDFPAAIEYIEKTIALFEGLGRKDGVARNLGNIGNVYLSISDYPRALSCFQRALALFEELGYKGEIANTFSNIGMVYRTLSDYIRALEYYQKAIAINEEIGSKSGIATNLGNIGIVHQQLSDHPRAVEYFQKSLVLYQELGNKYGIAALHGNLGNVNLLLGEYQPALEHLQQAIALYGEIGHKEGVALNLGNIGSVYMELSEYQYAMEYFQKALVSNQELNIKEGIAASLGHIGTVYSYKNYDGYNAVEAEEYLLKAIALHQELGIKESMYENHLQLYNLYKNLGRTAEALENFEKFHYLQEEVKGEEAKKMAQRSAYERQIGEMQREQDVTDRILHNILPREIALRIRRGDEKIVDSYDSVSVLFADIVGFTKLSQRVTPEELVASLDGIFNTFDALADKHGCEKIKTIGDCYMVVAGLPERCANHAERLSAMAVDMVEAIENFPAMVEGVSIKMRIGMHSGSVVAGIIGKNKYSYDLWGDAVNTASRMESNGEAGKIHCTEEFLKKLLMVNGEWSREAADEFLKKLLMVNGEWLMEGTDDFSSFNINHLPFTINHVPFTIISRGEMDIKGKGKMKTYFLEKI